MRPPFTAERLRELATAFNAECKALLVEIVEEGETPERKRAYEALQARGTYLYELTKLVQEELYQQARVEVDQQIRSTNTKIPYDA